MAICQLLLVIVQHQCVVSLKAYVYILENHVYIVDIHHT